MAEGGNYEHFQKFLECSICLDVFEDPKMLSCTHEFCKQCLEDILTFSNDGSATIVCPLRCGKDTILNNQETVHDLPASYTTKNMVDAVRKTTSSSLSSNNNAPLCKATECCDKLISVFCCGVIMCKSCYNAHVGTSESKAEHDKLTLSYDQRMKKLNLVCEKHSADCSYLCVDNKFLCMYCLQRDSNHKGHAKNTIETEVKLLKEAMSNEMVAQKKVERNRRDEVAVAQEKLKSELDQRKEQCLKQYKSFLDEEEKILMDKMTNMGENHVKGVQLNLHDCEEISKKLDVEIVLRKEEILKKLNEIRDTSKKHVTVSLEGKSDYLSHGPLGDICIDEKKPSEIKNLNIHFHFSVAESVDIVPDLDDLSLLGKERGFYAENPGVSLLNQPAEPVDVLKTLDDLSLLTLDDLSLQGKERGFYDENPGVSFLNQPAEPVDVVKTLDDLSLLGKERGFYDENPGVSFLNQPAESDDVVTTLDDLSLSGKETECYDENPGVLFLNQPAESGDVVTTLDLSLPGKETECYDENPGVLFLNLPNRKSDTRLKVLKPDKPVLHDKKHEERSAAGCVSQDSECNGDNPENDCFSIQPNLKLMEKGCESSDEVMLEKSDTKHKVLFCGELEHRQEERTVTELKSQGNAYFKQGQYEKAIEQYTEGIKLSVGDETSETSGSFIATSLSVLHQNRAAANEQLKRWKEVVDDCTNALKLSPMYTKAMYRRSNAHQQLGQTESAYEDMALANHLTQANGSLKEQKYIQAEGRLLDLLTENLRQENYINRRDSTPAVHHVKRTLQQFSYDVFTIVLESTEENMNYCEIMRYMKEEKYKEVLERCEREIGLPGAHSDRAKLLRGTLKWLDLPETSMKDFQVVSRLVPTGDNKLLRFDAFLKMAMVLNYRDETDECLIALDLASKIDKDNATLYCLKGICTRRLHQYEESYFKISASLDGAFAEPRLMLIMEYLIAHSFDKIVECQFEKLFKDFPEFSFGRFYYATILSKYGRTQEAIDVIEVAIHLDPHNAGYYVLKASFFTNINSVIREKLLLKAIQVDHTFGEAFFAMGRLELEKGNRNAALENLHRAARWCREDGQLQSHLENLKLLKVHELQERSKQYYKKHRLGLA